MTTTTDDDPKHVSLDPATLLEHVSEDSGLLDLKSFQSSNTTNPGQKKKRKRTKIVLKSVPRVVLPPPSDPKLLQSLYSTFHALHLSAATGVTEERKDQAFSWKSIQGLFASLKDDTASWCVETKGGHGAEPSPRIFLKPDVNAKEEDYRGYCSFLLQKDRSILEEHLSKLPMQELSPVWSHGDCIWFFFGRNSNNNNGQSSILEGRPEHTDSVLHDGTWHFQLSGTKRWLLRPTEELVELLKSSSGFELDPAQVLQVDCQEGDVLVVNTRLWWHRTELPPQENKPSVSYARDFYFTKEKESVEGKSNMTNVDGLYAPKNLEEGVVVFREDDMPECELHRSKEPNCEVVFLEEEESYAVISMRKIKAGEFFCVADSDDEEGEEFDEEESVDDDDDSDSDGQ